MTRDGRIQLVILLLVLAAAILWPSAAMFYTDWLWFQELGYPAVFSISLTTRLGLGSSAALLTFVWLFLNFRIALRQFAEPYLVLGVSPADGSPIVVQRRGVTRLVSIVPVVVAAGVGLVASNHWMEWLKFLHATPFGETDPIFGRDIADFVFRLPWLSFVRGLAMVVVVLSLAGAVAIYLLPGREFTTRRGGPFVAPGPARQHLSLLAALVLLLLGAGAWLDTLSLAVSPEGIIQGAKYSDVTIRLPALNVLAAMSVVGALLAVANVFVRRPWLLLGAFGLYAVTWMGGEAAATAVQRLVVTPNEQVKETPYISYNIAFTRKAYDLDTIQERGLSGDATLTRADIANNAATMENVRLWDHQPLLDTFGQIQEIRTYYDFT